MTSAISTDFANPEATFRDFVKIRSVSAEGPTTGTYRQCTAFLENFVHSQLKPYVKNADQNFKTQSFEFVENKPVLLTRILGSDPSLPKLLLNSHYDVVPVFPEKWTRDPFGAEVVDGKIYGRGTQDMKCVCVQYVYGLKKVDFLFLA